ncbi:MAG: transglutaminase family protein [Desulfuromonadales bacterium]|jgi:transglutaminase-like putative cysteine protease
MRYRVAHTTEFIYAARVGLCYNEARLLPRDLPQQSVQTSGLQIEPMPHDYYERFDYFGNRTVYFSIQQPHDQLCVTAHSEVDTSATIPEEAAGRLSWEMARERLRNVRSAEILDASQFVLDSPTVVVNDLILNYALPSFTPGRPLIEAVHDLMQRIFHEFNYDPEFSTIATPLKDVLEHRSGVCQDFAHLAIGCLRSMGLAARYVSGYIETEPPPGEERLVGADASHAWFSAFLPEHGWLDFDPTNNQLPGERHITVAWGRDFADVTPLKGVAFGSGEHELKVAVDVLAIE